MTQSRDGKRVSQVMAAHKAKTEVKKEATVSRAIKITIVLAVAAFLVILGATGGKLFWMNQPRELHVLKDAFPSGDCITTEMIKKSGVELIKVGNWNGTRVNGENPTSILYQFKSTLIIRDNKTGCILEISFG
ncbi:MAG: hypothetical protein ABIM99_02155 [Candidatus Dojkabacteria bacterium]